MDEPPVNNIGKIFMCGSMDSTEKSLWKEKHSLSPVLSPEILWPAVRQMASGCRLSSTESSCLSRQGDSTNL